MKKPLVSLYIAVILLLLPFKTFSDQSWKSKMQDLYVTLSQLLTNISSESRFNDQKNAKQILAQTERLARLTHESSKQKMSLPSADPTLQIINGLLSRELEDAVTALKSGNRTFARTILSTIPSYCVSCHTRDSSGEHFKELNLEPTEKKLSSFERGEFFAATRQFDRALSEFDKSIKDKKLVTQNHWAWRKSIQDALTIAVRVKDDPKLALEIIQTVKDSKEAPYFLKEDAKEWEKAVVDWKSDAPKDEPNETDQLNKAKQLIAKAREIQKFAVDRSADIYYLRASSILHRSLKTAKTERIIAEALLMLGMSYEVLSPLRNDNLHQIYYESCILKAPHTETSELCYRRYEENLILGFSGSGGTSIPKSLRTRLHQLETLSKKMDSVLKPR